jgi:hypothetical protein
MVKMSKEDEEMMLKMQREASNWLKKRGVAENTKKEERCICQPLVIVRKNIRRSNK